MTECRRPAPDDGFLIADGKWLMQINVNDVNANADYSNILEIDRMLSPTPRYSLHPQLATVSTIQFSTAIERRGRCKMEQPEVGPKGEGVGMTETNYAVTHNQAAGWPLGRLPKAARRAR